MTRPQIVRAACLALGSAILLSATGCTKPQMASPVRAIWVTRMDYKTADDIRQIMANCSEAGFNNVVFQVRGNGTTFYRSKIEPWAEQFDFQDPGYDPLALACTEARRHKMELHAWVNVVPAWRGTKPPTNPQQIYNTHPEWFWYDQNGNRQPLTSFYVSLNPCLPEVRDYIVSVMREIVANYPVDGLHMDYIRFPNEPPAIPARSGIDYPRDKKTLELYKAQTGKAPDDDKQAWDNWRAQQVTALVRQIRDMMRWTSPRTALSASVGTNRESSMAHFRDEIRWTEEHLVDTMFPMNYKSDLASFDSGLEMWMPLRDRVQVVPGLWFAPTNQGEKGVQVVRQQIESSVAKMGNFCLFSYASLFATGEASSTDTPASRPAGRRAGGRELRQRELLPYIRSLAKQPGPVASAQ